MGVYPGSQVVVGLSDLSEPLEAAGLIEGQDFYARKEFASALKIFRPLAEQGNALAACYLGLMYEYGQCLEQNVTEAARLPNKATPVRKIIWV